MSSQDGYSARPGRPLRDYFPRTSSPKTPKKSTKPPSKTADAGARNFNSIRRPTQKGDYLDGPPGIPQETYTVQSKKKTDEGEIWQAIVAINSSTAHNLHPNTPNPSAKNFEPRRRTQSLHGPKPLNEPFLVLSRNKKRFISQAAATASKKRIVSDDLKASPKDTVQRTLFKKELAEISAASNRNLAAYTTNRGFVTLNQKSELKNEIAIFEGQESNDKKVTTTGFDDLTDCEYLFNSDYEEFPTPKRRRRTGSAKITVIEGYTTSDIKDESTVD